MFIAMFHNHEQNRVQNRVQNHVRNHVQNRVQNDIQNHILKSTNMANKICHFQKFQFLRKKRDFMVNEFLKTRQNIQENFLSEFVVDLSTQYELS